MLSSVLLADPVVVSGGPENDYESWIARLRDGRLMVVFDRNPDFRSGDLYVTFSTDDGATWNAPTAIITGTADQPLPCFVELPGDTFRLWYSSNETGFYRVHSAWSLDGLSWTEEGVVPLGWPTGTPDYYDPTVVLCPDSSLVMLYSVSTTGAHVARKPWGGEWDTLRTLVGANGRRPRIMRHSDGTHLAVYQRRSGGGQYDIDVFSRTSTDLRDWTAELQLTTNLNSHDPFCCETPDTGYVVYYAKAIGSIYYLHRRRSPDAVNWEPEEQLTFEPVRNTQPHVFFENGNEYLVYARATDYPSNHDVYFSSTPWTGLAEGEVRHAMGTPGLPSVIRRGTDLELPGLSPGTRVRAVDATGRVRLAHPSVLPAGVWFVRVGSRTRRILVVD